MKNEEYRNYFSNHYGYSFSNDDLKKYRQWFYAQWRFISGVVKLGHEKRMLEIGSGIGGFYSFIKNSNYVGLELDDRAVVCANKMFDGNKFVNIDFFEYNINDKFDYVFAFEVLEHFRNPSNAIGKIYNHLNRGGFFIGTSPYPYLKNVKADKTHLSVLHPVNWQQLFKNAGFKKVRIIPMTFFPFIWRINKKFNIKLPFYLPFKYFISTCLIIGQK